MTKAEERRKTAHTAIINKYREVWAKCWNIHWRSSMFVEEPSKALGVPPGKRYAQSFKFIEYIGDLIDEVRKDAAELKRMIHEYRLKERSGEYPKKYYGRALPDPNLKENWIRDEVSTYREYLSWKILKKQGAIK